MKKYLHLFGKSPIFIYLIGIIVFYFYFNQLDFYFPDTLLSFTFCSPVYKGSNWMFYFSHVILGLFIIVFTLGLIIHYRKRGLIFYGKLLLLLSGLLWICLGTIKFISDFESVTFFFIAMFVFMLIFASFGFIFISIENVKLTNKNRINWVLLILGFTIIVGGILDILVLSDSSSEYFISDLGFTPIVLYLLGFYQISYSIKKAHNKGS